MAVLVGLDGKQMVRSLPQRFSAGQSLAGPFPPLWSGGETVDAFGDHGVQSGTLVSFDNLYRTQPAVAACVNKLVRLISVAPIVVYKVNGDNRTPVTDKDHPLRRLIDHPAPRRSELSLKQWFAMAVLVHGNSLLAKFREEADGPPTALLPVKWQYTSAYAEPGGPVEWWSTAQTGEERYFPVEESVHFAWESPSGELGVSPLEQLGVTIRLEDASQRYSTSSFQNAARPSLAVKLPADKRADKEVRDAIRDEISKTHGGVDQAFLTMVLGGGAEIEQLSHSAAEAELIEQRRLNFQEVCRVFDVSPQLLGDTSGSSYSTMTEVQKMAYKMTLMPWLELVTKTMHAHLIEGEEEFEGCELQFDFRDQLRGTPSEELAAAVQAYVNGLAALNEVRQGVGLPKVPGEENDKPRVPTNNLSEAGAAGDGRAIPNNPQGQRGGSATPIERPPTSPPQA